MQKQVFKLFRLTALHFNKMPTAAVATTNGAGAGTTAETSKSNPSHPASDPNKPHLLVFDMNYTLWPHHIIEEPSPPLRRDDSDPDKKKILDANGEEFTPFEGIEEALRMLKSQGHKLAIASTAKDPEQAQKVLDLLEWNDMFDYKAIMPGKPKTRHFNKLHDESKIDFTDMLFFDDRKRNIDDVKKMGVTCAEVGDELTWKDIERGLKMYKRNESD